MRKWSLKDLHRILRVALLNACDTFSPHFFEWWVGVTQIIMSTGYCAILKCLLYVFCICCPNTKFPDQKEKKLQKWSHVQSADRMILESTRTAYSHISCSTGCAKSYVILEQINMEYDKHFDYIIVIICPMLWWNKTQFNKDWIRQNDNTWLTEPKDKWVNKYPVLVTGS